MFNYLVFLPTACDAGTYRSASDAVDRCLTCPSNTFTVAVGTAECKCLTGYYRNNAGLASRCPSGQNEERAGLKCTRKYNSDVAFDWFVCTQTLLRYISMRDEEGRKKEASKVKRTTRQSNTAHPRQSLFLRKMSNLEWDSNPRYSTL